MSEELTGEYERLIEAAEWVGTRIVIEPGSAIFPGEDTYRRVWYVSGGGLGRAQGDTLAEALTDWLEGLVSCAKHDPDYFGRFAEVPHFGSEEADRG